jgi:hypothetical protein
LTQTFTHTHGAASRPQQGEQTAMPQQQATTSTATDEKLAVVFIYIDTSLTCFFYMTKLMQKGYSSTIHAYSIWCYIRESSVLLSLFNLFTILQPCFYND